MVSLKIVDEKGKEVEPDELTDIGIGQIIFECKQIKERLEEIYNQQSDEEIAEIASEQAAEHRASVMRRNLDQAGNEAAQFQRESWE